MYAAFMDTRHINALGVTPIAPDIAAIKTAADRTALAQMMGRSNFDFGASFFQASFDIDLKVDGGMRFT